MTGPNDNPMLAFANMLEQEADDEKSASFTGNVRDAIRLVAKAARTVAVEKPLAAASPESPARGEYWIEPVKSQPTEE